MSQRTIDGVLLEYDRRQVVLPEPMGVVVLARRQRRYKARYLSNPGRRRAGEAAVSYDMRNAPFYVLEDPDAA